MSSRTPPVWVPLGTIEFGSDGKPTGNVMISREWSRFLGGITADPVTEVPAGLVNGTNAVFTLANAPNPLSSLFLFKNGLKMRLGTSFTLAGPTITFAVAPTSGDALEAIYRS